MSHLAAVSFAINDLTLYLDTHPDVIAPLKFLRAREIVHFQRFGEALEMTKESLNSKNFYHFNPAFDKTKDLPL